VTGYPDLARKYRVSSVPKTVVGESREFVGAGAESMLLKHVEEAARGPASPLGGGGGEAILARSCPPRPKTRLQESPFPASARSSRRSWSMCGRRGAPSA
jgi:hypothetical protein